MGGGGERGGRGGGGERTIHDTALPPLQHQIDASNITDIGVNDFNVQDITTSIAWRRDA